MPGGPWWHVLRAGGKTTRCVRSAHDLRRCCAHLARSPLPAGGVLRRRGHQLRPVLRGRRPDRAVPVRRRRERDPGRPARAQRARLARLPAPDRARASGTATGCTAPTTRRRVCAATRRSCCSTRTPRRSTGDVEWDEALFSYRFGDPDCPQRHRLRALRDELGGDQPVLRLGRRPAPAHPLQRDGDLRGARQGHDDAAPGHPRGRARHLRGPGAPGDDPSTSSSWA